MRDLQAFKKRLKRVRFKAAIVSGIGPGIVLWFAETVFHQHFFDVPFDFVYLGLFLVFAAIAVDLSPPDKTIWPAFLKANTEIWRAPMPLAVSCLKDGISHAQFASPAGGTNTWEMQTDDIENGLLKYQITVPETFLTTASKMPQMGKLIFVAHLTEAELGTSVKIQYKLESLLLLPTVSLVISHTLGCIDFARKQNGVLDRPLHLRVLIQIGRWWCCYIPRFHGADKLRAVNLWEPKPRQSH